jgi:hypothetical protein
VSLGGFFETRETGKARRQGLGQQPGQARYLVTEHERVVDRLLLRYVVLDQSMALSHCSGICTAIGAPAAACCEWRALAAEDGIVETQRRGREPVTPHTARNLTCSLLCDASQLALQGPN